MSKPYRVESRGQGCPTCQHDEQYDIIGPDESAHGQSWGDAEEAEYICSLLNIAFYEGRVSMAQENLATIKERNAAPAEPTPTVIPPAPALPDDIPF